MSSVTYLLANVVAHFVNNRARAWDCLL